MEAAGFPDRVTGRYIKAGEVLTYYEEYGEGKPIVMLHGDSWNIENLSEQIPYFSRDYRVILPERRGHGRSQDLPGAWSYELFADDVAAFMDALGLKGAHLLGHSGGADIALMAAMRRQDLVDRLVPISPSGPVYSVDEGGRSRILAMSVESFRQRAPMIVESNERVIPDGASKYPGLFEKSKGLWLREWEMTKEQLGRITSPTLIMVGDRDFGTVEDSARLSRMIPGGQLCVVPRATHGLMRMRADVVNPLIKDFLDGPV